MNILTDAYYKKIAENEKNINFWQNHLNSLDKLNFNEYRDKLKVSALIPIGSRIFFRGELKHTNEITVSLGADYFVKCSLHQAEILRQHRLNKAKSNLDTLRREKEYLENQITFSKQNLYESSGKEIIEEYDETEDKAWRKTHAENLRQYKQKKSKETNSAITDEELWERLEELELQEELEAELNSITKGNEMGNRTSVLKYSGHEVDSKLCFKEVSPLKMSEDEIKTPKQTSNLDLLQQIIDKQNDLKQKLLEIKNKNEIKSKPEDILLEKLEELECLEEIEDEMDRLDDILEENDCEEEVTESDDEETPTLKKSISFADEDNSETIQITFKHSEIEPSTKQYNPNEGILTPNDIYLAHPKSLKGKSTSILKKTKYGDSEILNNGSEEDIQKIGNECSSSTKKTIMINDVVEKTTPEENNVQHFNSRPISLFKERRQKLKTSSLQ